MPAPLLEAGNTKTLTEPSDPPRDASTIPVEVPGNPNHFARAFRDLARDSGGDWTMVFSAMILTHAVLRAERAPA